MILLIIKGLSPTAMYEVDVGVGFGASATPVRARWKKRGDTLCARRHVMGFCTQGSRLGIPPCAKTAGPSANGRICLASRATSERPPRSNESCRASPTLFSCANPYESKLSTDPRTKKCPSRRDGHFRLILVEVVGFEPATPCLQSMCSTS